MSLHASPTIPTRQPNSDPLRIRSLPHTISLPFSTNRVFSKSPILYCVTTPRGADLAPLQEDLPLSIDLNPICSEEQFDQVVSQATTCHELLIVVWMASWCRKCIYLKPKLQRLAAEYYPRLRFYCVDVNAVPHKLVSRAGVTKMPTIQLWKDSEKQSEVIGGHKAYLVVNEVREMIENELTSG